MYLVHGIFSSSTTTSLRATETYYRQKGYNVEYIQYDSLTEDPTQLIIDKAKSGDIVIGHSLGGRYVSKASLRGDPDVAYYTVNSPFSAVNDNAVDLKHRFDWVNVLQFFMNPFALFDQNNRWSSGGHSVSQEQVV